MAGRSKRTPRKIAQTRTSTQASGGKAKTRKKTVTSKPRSDKGERQKKRKKRTCFVIMPFGEKETTVPTRKKNGKKSSTRAKKGSELWKQIELPGEDKEKVRIDFDEVYKRVIEPALTDIDDYEIEVKRCDEIIYTGWIHEKMIERIASADIAIVDLTTLNPNVFYELGVRHALSESVTVLIQLAGLEQSIPFNLGGMTVVKYDDKDLEKARDDIQQTVTESLLRREHVDSLVFRTLPDLEVTVTKPRVVQERRFHHFTLPDHVEPKRCLGIVTGDIANVDGIDIWVNSENTEMMMARYHEQAISATIRFLGAERGETDQVKNDVIDNALRGAMQDVNCVPAGSVVVTTAGELSKTHGVKWIFHAAAVIGQVGGGYGPIPNVKSCVNNALKKADSEDFRGRNRSEFDRDVESILFPVLGTGQAGADLEDTVADLMDTARAYLKRSPHSTITRVYFLAFTIRDEEACVRVLQSWGLSEGESWSDPGSGNKAPSRRATTRSRSTTQGRK